MEPNLLIHGKAKKDTNIESTALSHVVKKETSDSLEGYLETTQTFEPECKKEEDESIMYPMQFLEVDLHRGSSQSMKNASDELFKANNFLKHKLSDDMSLLDKDDFIVPSNTKELIREINESKAKKEEDLDLSIEIQDVNPPNCKDEFSNSFYENRHHGYLTETTALKTQEALSNLSGVMKETCTSMNYIQEAKSVISNNVTNKIEDPPFQLSRHLGANPRSCNVCGKQFPTPSKLSRHERTHTGERPYACTLCGKAFSHPHNLTAHERAHAGEKPYTCEECGKSFTQSSHLAIHKKMHRGEKPYTCTTCGKTFSQVDKLSVHERTHTGEKPYTCTICNKAFSRADVLTCHQRTHTGEKPYTCITCGKAFAQLSNYNRHQRTHFEDT